MQVIFSLPQVDMNFLAHMLPGMIDLHDLGRMVVCFAPTASFGTLHPKLDLRSSSSTSSPSPTSSTSPLLPKITPDDFVRVQIHNPKKNLNPATGRKLRILCWGPDTKWVAKTLHENLGLSSELNILCYVQAPLKLIEDLNKEPEETDVVLVDQNPNCGLFGPVLSVLRSRVSNKNVRFAGECSINPAFVPYGFGGGLLNGEDFKRSLLYSNGVIVENLFNLNLIFG